MVLSKSYLRYEPAGCFGLVGSLKANVLFVEGEALGLKSSVQLAVVPALEDVFIWDTKKEEKVNRAIYIRFTTCIGKLYIY